MTCSGYFRHIACSLQVDLEPKNILTRMLRLTALRQIARASAVGKRQASTTTIDFGVKENVPAVESNTEEDPQLAGLGYPQFKGMSRQLRPAKSGWWDEQDRLVGAVYMRWTIRSILWLG